MSTLLKMQKFHPLCSRCIGMYPLQNRWTVLRYLQCYENFSECCTHLILPETALFSPTPTFAKEPIFFGFCTCPCAKLPYNFRKVQRRFCQNQKILISIEGIQSPEFPRPSLRLCTFNGTVKQFWCHQRLHGFRLCQI